MNEMMWVKIAVVQFFYKGILIIISFQINLYEIKDLFETKVWNQGSSPIFIPSLIGPL